MEPSGSAAVQSTSRADHWLARFHAWALSKGNLRYEALMAERKRSLIGSVSGTVVEIGPGAGPNLVHYPRGVRWIGIEPNPFFHQRLRANMEKAQLAGEIRSGSAEELGLPDSSADFVVGTLVLCSVPDVAGALREILRVLRPGGRYFFIEHVAALKGTGLRSVQRISCPVCAYLAGGCHPDRETWLDLEAAGFEELKYEHFRMPAPVTSPHIAGFGRKRRDVT